ncbi:E3 ubiquitin-protein ligase SH3RF3-like [Watersipora subatra]|uniref:E3 ubiquitin-protein ligase SH3RF3-like n=1 Tax=Watersipora subatra TaxID=2589382 RepID=UPI00355BE00C
MNMDVLSEIIECSVCLERMDTKSKVLPCQHTFCSDCLHRIYIQNKNELRCPECRCVCNVPVRNLPSNILLMRLLEGMKTSGNPISGKREVLREAGQPCAEAIYTYEPQEPGDLKFKRGDLIYLKKRLDENWFVGELNGRSGYLPATYVKVICPFPITQGKSPSPALNASPESSSPHSSFPSKVMVRALYDFEMKEEEKEDCLKFKKDEAIQLIRRVDLNWAEGRLAGVIGIFPLNYVQLTEAAKALLDNSLQRANSTPKRSPQHASRSRNVSGPPTLALPIAGSELVEPGQKLMEGAAVEEKNGENSDIGILSSERQLGRLSCDGSYRSGFHTINTVCEGSQASSEGSRVRSKFPSDGMPVKIDERGLVQNKISTHDIYRALYDYKPQKDDELALTRGALYRVTDRCKDGWYRGHSIRLAATGVFPGNYVQLIPPDSEGASGDAIRTMSRGRLAPPSERQLESGFDSKEAGSESKSPHSLQMNSDDCRIPSPKMRTGARRTGSARDRRRSSSLSRLENQSTSVIRLSDQPRSFRGRSGKALESKANKTTRVRYVCVMAYPAQGDLELDLKVGDVVVVLKKKSEGWYKGTNETSGKTGIFPARFVQSFSSSSSGNESRSS